jgi:hypothetical protein
MSPAAGTGVNTMLSGKVLTRTIAVISQALIYPVTDLLLIAFLVLALYENRAIPFHSMGSQCLKYLALCAGLVAWLIQIFHANQPMAMPLACI